MYKKIDKYIVKENITIKDSLSVINKSGHNTIFVVDKNGVLKGSLTDGDIRRALLGNAKQNNKIKNIYNKSPKYLFNENYEDKDVKNLFLKNKINIVPILNTNKTINKLIRWEEYFLNTKKKKKQSFLSKTTIVVMAGGKGTRLKPYTNILPKPLLPINDKAIIEHIIDNFIFYGAKKFYISINVKNYIIKAFFREKFYKEEITFLEEKKSLGTCGSLSLINYKSISENFILTNCDIISYIDLNKLIAHHKKNSSIMTLVAAQKNHTLSYGSIELDQKGFLENIKEKPSYNLLVNIGIYVINKKCLQYIPKNKPLDINHLIETLKNRGESVSIFQINDEEWLDTGQIKEIHNVKNILEN